MDRRFLASVVGVVVAGTAGTVATGTGAQAHGTLSSPASRVYTCYQENPESPKSAACKAAVAETGPQAFYSWNEVSLADVAGRHRDVIPDGKLCSAGRDKFRALDLRRADWPATPAKAGAFQVNYHATAPHAGSDFEFYITRDGWNPTMPLNWGDLVHLTTFSNVNPVTDNKWTLDLPQRSGRQLLYSIWQRVAGSGEAFYTCSDLDFGGGTSTPTPTPTTTPKPTATPTTAPTTPGTATPTPSRTPTTRPTTTPRPTATKTPRPGGKQAWRVGGVYKIGSRATFRGRTYRCIQAHTAYAGWEPPIVPALWQRV
ncbi:lytic polysaccharide monooxygenase [Actinocorallia longicatena]|uniref:Chitin-binding type-3 domain-containing protein n=1 Tax=Actinocorallia longicatena TaxID=111803 RepID=A0ABP6Q9B9_9ACTN